MIFFIFFLVGIVKKKVSIIRRDVKTIRKHINKALNEEVNSLTVALEGGLINY